MNCEPECGTGYVCSPELLCADIDECESGQADCDERATCSNTDGGFTCTCPSGFAGDGTRCQDIDECAAGTANCDPRVDCLNMPGRYECGPCPVGYQDPNGDSAVCVDLDECNIGAARCDPLVACLNEDGGYKCGPCPLGFEDVNGDGSLCDAYQPVFIKASNPGQNDMFGWASELSADGSTLAVSTIQESSGARGIGGDQFDDSALFAGAVYVFSTTNGVTQEAYVKPSNVDADDYFGHDIALSADGSVLVVGAPHERSSSTGVGGIQTDNSLLNAGAVYVFVRTNGVWQQTNYIKSSNTRAGDSFGYSVALSADGTTLVVSAPGESSGDSGVDADQLDSSAQGAGAVYVFRRIGTMWAQEAYIKASNAGAGDQFGHRVRVSDDGNTFVAGAFGEDSSARGVNGDDQDNSAMHSGAAYVFGRQGSTWMQEAYMKAPNSDADDQFGVWVAISGDGELVAVTQGADDSAASGVDGDGIDNTLPTSGAVHTFRKIAGAWAPDAYFKASNPGDNDLFGAQVALSGDGQTLLVTAHNEDSAATGFNGNELNEQGTNSGATYRFRWDGASWAQDLYIKAPNNEADDDFGCSLGLAADGNHFVIGNRRDSSASAGIGGDLADNSLARSGAVFLYHLP